jgi:hypothetical protein
MKTNPELKRHPDVAVSKADSESLATGAPSSATVAGSLVNIFSTTVRAIEKIETSVVGAVAVHVTWAPS